MSLSTRNNQNQIHSQIIINQSPISQIIDSDQQKTIDHMHISSSPLTIQNLINQNKMKQIALNKATHLIDLLKIQLEVQKNSQQQSIQIIQNKIKHQYQRTIKQNQRTIKQYQRTIKQYQRTVKQYQRNTQQYQKEIQQYQRDIKQLNQKIQYYQLKLVQYQMQQQNDQKQKQKLNVQLRKQKKSKQKFAQKQFIKPRLSKTSSTNQLNQNALNRKSHPKPPSLPTSTQLIPLKRNASTLLQPKQQTIIFQKSFLIQYILKTQENSQKYLNQLKEILEDQENQQIGTKIMTIKQGEKVIEQWKKDNDKKDNQYQIKLKQYNDVIKVQHIVIQEQDRIIDQYQHNWKKCNRQFKQIYSSKFQQSDQQQYSKNTFSPSNFISKFHLNQNPHQQISESIQKCEQQIRSCSKRYKNITKQKFLSMQSQNSELKRILDDMIKLVKRNKRLNVGGIVNLNSQF